MPYEWGNIVREGRDGYLRFDYSMTTPILWSALQHALNKTDKLEKDINKLKKDNSDSDRGRSPLSGRSRDGERSSPSGRSRDASPKAKAKAKAKAKSKD